MRFSSDVQQLIEQVEDLSSRPVHVSEEEGMTVRASVTPARQGAPAHMLRYKPGSPSLDYLVANQLGFLIRTFSCPSEDRWEIAGTTEEEQVGMKAMGLTEVPPQFAKAMIGQIIIQVRSCSIGIRVDRWLRETFPGLRAQQETEIRSQLAENERALAPEIREKFPKPLVDTNSAMNALFATVWGEILDEPRFATPFLAMGYAERARGLQSILDEVPEEPTSDRALVDRWAKALGLEGAYHFKPYTRE